MTDRVAGIDCGTNSIRLLVADRDGEALTDVLRRMEIVRLGQGVEATGRVAPEAIARTRAALADYAGQLRGLGASRVRMVATSATRDATNAESFHAMVTSVLGVPPEVITGEQEARLSFRGAVAGLPADVPAPYLVVDIGGGSTEFVVGTAEVDRARSVDIGSVRMTERHLHGDPPTADQVAAAETDIRAVVDGALAAVGGARAGSLIGLAGSVTTVAGIALDLPRYDSTRIHHARIAHRSVAAITDDLLRRSAEQRRRIAVMHPGRADVIAAGALILRIIAERTGLDPILVSEHDILDGIALSA